MKYDILNMTYLDIEATFKVLHDKIKLLERENSKLREDKFSLKLKIIEQNEKIELWKQNCREWKSRCDYLSGNKVEILKGVWV